MPDEPSHDELARLAQRMVELKKENERIDLELQALQDEGDARLLKKEDSGPKSGRLFNSRPPDSKKPE